MNGLRIRSWRALIFLGLIYLGYPVFSIHAETDSSVEPDLETAGVECVSESIDGQVPSGERLNRKLIAQHEGKTIRAIDVISKDVFDTDKPSENRFLYRLANGIQINTQESVVSAQLLFAEGDYLSLRDVEESLRILYARQYILDVKLILTAACNEHVDLAVIVRDAWVLEPTISGGQKGGESTSTLGITDGNFLGSGTELGFAYKKSALQSEWLYHLKTHNLFKQNIDAELFYEDKEGGVGQIVSLAKPFFSSRTEWAYGFRGEQTIERQYIRFRGEVVNEYTQRVNRDELHIGKAIEINKRGAFRVTLGVTREEEQFNELNERTASLPEEQGVRYSWLKAAYVTNDYRQFMNLAYIGREDDVPLANEYSFTLGTGTLEGGDELLVLEGALSTTRLHLGNHLYLGRISGELYYNKTSASIHKSAYTLDSKYFYFLNGKNRWAADLSYSNITSSLEHDQLSVGDLHGIRGYPLSYQRGDKRYLASLERRFYSSVDLFGLIRVGAVMFIDAGRAWGDKQYKSESTIASTGFGFRFHSSKTGEPAVIHLDVGIPLIRPESDLRIDDYLVSVSVEAEF